jgi:hypothetical protein
VTLTGETAYAAPADGLRPRDLLPAAGTLVAAGALATAAASGHTAFGLAVLAAQALVTLAWLALTEVDGAEGAAAVVLASAAGADLLAFRDGGEGIKAAAGVVALAFVASLALQLFRRHRARTTDALTGTITAVVLVVFAAHLLAAGAKTSAGLAAAALLCPAAAVAAGRAGDLVSIRPLLVADARRGWLGLLAGVAAAAGLGAVLGVAWAPLSGASGAVLGVVTGLAAAVADLAVDLAAADAFDARRAAALRPLGMLLPLVVAAPVAYAAARLLIG